MSKKLIVSAMVAAGFLSFGAAANAQFLGVDVLAANIAVNTSKVDGSVKIDNTNTFGGGVAIGGDSANLNTQLNVNVNSNQPANVDITLAPELKAQVGSSISTTAIGAANMGDITINAAQEGTQFSVNGSYQNNFQADHFFDHQATSTTFDFGMAYAGTSNPDVAALQVAWNSAPVDASIGINSNSTFGGGIDIKNTDMKTTAIGALNAGNISVTIPAAK